MAKIIKGRFPGSEKGKGEEKKPAPLYQFTISLTYSEPKIWRRFQVPGDFKLSQMHDIICVLMGWSGQEAHQFYIGKIFYEMTAPQGSVVSNKRFDESKFTLHDLEESMKWCFLYLYDAGEGWEHEIELEETLPATKGVGHPVLLEGERNSPTEDFNGIHEYEAYVSTLDGDSSSSVAVVGQEEYNAPHILNVKAINALFGKMKYSVKN